MYAMHLMSMRAAAGAAPDTMMMRCTCFSHESYHVLAHACCMTHQLKHV